ncbi:MAG: hypothetical protein GEU95_01195 [Rhizobiales bacterium]|nr:hypothetical protein [Hyphomicrobiales bacterium]
MPLKLSVRVGQSIAIGGPTTLRVESKSGQEIGLVFDADRSVPIRIIDDAPAKAATGATGLGLEGRDTPPSPGLGRK